MVWTRNLPLEVVFDKSHVSVVDALQRGQGKPTIAKMGLCGTEDIDANASDARPNVLRMRDTNIEGEARDPRYLVAQSKAIVDTRLPNGPIDRSVKSLTDNNGLE